MTQRTTAHHRPTRRAPEDAAALDYAYDAGQRAYQNEVLQERLHEAQRRLAPPSRARSLWNWTLTILVFGGSLFVFFLAGQASIVPRAPASAVQPLGTAEIVPTRRAPAPPDSPAVDRDIAAYNLAQRATAEALQASQEAPTATEAPAGYIIITATPEEPPTPMPEPGAPGFDGSFQEPVCPPAGAYFTPLKGSPCYGRAGQAPLPEPGSDAFADSFK